MLAGLGIEDQDGARQVFGDAVLVVEWLGYGQRFTRLLSVQDRCLRSVQAMRGAIGIQEGTPLNADNSDEQG